MFRQIKKQNVANPAFSKEVKASKLDVSISSIIPRNDKWMEVNSSWKEVNSYLKDLCESTDILFISNTTINPKKHLNNSQPATLKLKNSNKLRDNSVPTILIEDLFPTN